MGSFYIKESVGLVDAKSESDFDEMLLKLGPVWASREAEFSSQQPSFYKWFCQYHAKDVKNSMTVPVREKAGLGHPPAHFTTNCNESMNKVIKKGLDYEEKNWDKFCDDMLSLVKIQYQELEKAVVCSGEYRFRPKFSYLQVPLSKWNRMSVKQREQHMKQVKCAAIATCSIQSPNPELGESACALDPDSTYSSQGPSTIPSDLWTSCVEKAKSIIANPTAMSDVPGGSCRSKFVLWSRNPESPIKVSAGKKDGVYTCNKTKCPTFAGYKICAHILAVAIHNGDDGTLVEKYNKAGKGPNLADLSMMGMPKNAGKKPQGKPRKRKFSQCNESSTATIPSDAISPYEVPQSQASSSDTNQLFLQSCMMPTLSL